MYVALNSFAKEIYWWNKFVFSNILVRKNRILGKLKGFQNDLYYNPNESLIRLKIPGYFASKEIVIGLEIMNGLDF